MKPAGERAMGVEKGLRRGVESTELPEPTISAGMEAFPMLFVFSSKVVAACGTVWVSARAIVMLRFQYQRNPACRSDEREQISSLSRTAP
jgi:hypothetical protein